MKFRPKDLDELVNSLAQFHRYSKLLVHYQLLLRLNTLGCETDQILSEKISQSY